jgi:divalent metal cation (Fe/Co/Zn/Cd) transporter
MTYIRLGGITALIIFGAGYPAALYSMKWLRQNQHTPNPLIALAIGVTASQIALLGIWGTYFCFVAREEGPRILWSLLLSFYGGSLTMFAAGAAIAGGLIGYLTAHDLKAVPVDKPNH